MSDLPPADWYTDPDDESQYRYWDGSAWTEHRAPRHTGPAVDPTVGPDAAPGGLRGPLKLIADTFSLIGRRWRGCAAAALIYIVSHVAMLALVIVSANRILLGELGEIWNRIADPAPDDPAPDLTPPQHQAYFDSLEFDLAPVNFVPAVVGLLAWWVAINVMQAAVTRITLDDLKNRALSTSDALRQALRRVPRLMGLDLQLLAIFVTAVPVIFVQYIVVALVGNVGLVLLILLIPAFIVGAFYAAVVTPLAYVVASVGPRRWSLGYGARLVRRRFWATLGRLTLLILMWLIFSQAVGLMPIFGPALELVLQLVSTVVAAPLAVVGLVAAAIVYHDLGGESD